jgi:PKD repeat protein
MPDINTVQKVTYTLTPTIGVTKAARIKQSVYPTVTPLLPIAGTVIIYPITPTPPIPPQPSNLEPPDGAEDVSLTPHFLSSPPLQDVNEEIIPWEEWDGVKFTRVDYHIQITTTSGDYSKPVYDFTSYWLIWKPYFPPGPMRPHVDLVLDYGTTYYWRIRYKDFRGVWSPWSNETSFTTERETLYFNYNPIKPIVDEAITFTAPTYPWIVSYEWDFDDGTVEHYTAPEGTVVTHRYREEGLYKVILTVTDDKGVETSTFRTIRVTKYWTFAIITDLHIGYCYGDYGTSGWDDSDGQGYWLTLRLYKIVDWINEHAESDNIHFVVILGDISDTGEKSELLKAREILNRLNVPYIPLIGNHDVWPYTQREEGRFWRDMRGGSIKELAPMAVGDQFFYEVFWKQNVENREKIGELFGDSFALQMELYDTTLPYILNYNFTYKGIKFIALDFVDRNPERRAESGGAVLHSDTKKWLNENLKEGEPTILLSHHPMFFDWASSLTGFIYYADACDVSRIITESKCNLLRNFAGHVHRTAETTGSVTGIEVVTTEAVCRESTLGPSFYIDRTGNNIRIVTMSKEGIMSYDTLRNIGDDTYWALVHPWWAIWVRSPVDLAVTDPDGFVITKDVGKVAGMYYLEYDWDGDGALDDMIFLDDVKAGDYQVNVIPEPGALQTDTYTLLVLGSDAAVVLAENIPVSDIPTEPYVVSSNLFTLNVPPVTLLHIGEPKSMVNNITYLTSATPVKLIAEDNPYGSGLSLTAYRIYNATFDSGWINYMQPIYLTGLSDGTYYIDYQSTDVAGNIEPANTAIVVLDNTPPTTALIIGEPKYVSNTTYVTPDTPFTLEANDNAGSGVYSIDYRIYNGTYDSGWQLYAEPFYLTALADGVYTLEFRSMDNLGNIEPTNIITVALDNSGPSVTLLNPPAGWALQDGVTFIVDAADAGSRVSSVSISVREADGGEGRPVGFEDLPLIYNSTTGKWTLFFDTLQLPDGYYIIIVKAKDNLGNTCYITVEYSIRNWAVIELLPTSENNKAGRTMPVKFALRVAASVDHNQPFVYNEDLTIIIYAKNDPNTILQISTFGDTARDYRINAISELYITNFQTLKTPTTYVVEIYRNEMRIGAFEFETVK